MYHTVHRNPFVTTDRKPPSWFVRELKRLDPLLRVEWWNFHPNPNIGPTFRLFRQIDSNRSVHIDYFKMCTQEYINYLRSIDCHNKEEDFETREWQRKYAREWLLDHRRKEDERNEKATQLSDEFAMACDRYKENVTYSYEKG